MTKKFQLGIDIGATKTAIVVIDDKGMIVASDRFPTPPFYENWFMTVTPIMDAMMKEYPIASIGIGVAGQVDDEESTLLHAPNLGWDQLPLKALFQRQYGLPTTVVGDVHAAAWGEWNLGSGRGYRHLAVLMIGTGVGGALIANGVLFAGAHHAAGELGHMIVGGPGPICSCGNEGCLEAQSGGWALAERYGVENAAEVIAKYKAGDEIAVKIIEDAHQALFRGCLTIVHAFNPSIILLGGGITHAFPDLASWLEEEIHNKALKASSKDLKIRMMELGDASVAVGAAHYAGAE